MEQIPSRLVHIIDHIGQIQRDVERLEAHGQRAYDNIDTTRHALNNSIQVIANQLGTMRIELNSLAKDLGPVISIAQEVRDARSQVSGAGKAFTWIWPLVSALVAVGAIGYVAWAKVP